MAGVGRTVVLGVLVTICSVHGTLENIALLKPASTTSGIYCGERWCWNASKAVDGNNNISGMGSTCFHAGGGPSDWTVDLQHEYQLFDIRVYPRFNFGHRIASSVIYVDSHSSRSCNTLPSTILNKQYDIMCNMTARYVTIRNSRAGEPGVLNICEVDIYVCSNGTYGSNCDVFCHCPHCDRWTGVCSGDCDLGWKGARCDTACSNRTYGLNCQGFCHCAQCNHSTGVCTGDCDPGWEGERCDTECDDQQYGANCSSACNARHCSGNSSCDHVTGACDHGCEAGWNGRDCRQECDNTTYGTNCSSVCAERYCYGNSTCDHVTGLCDQGCQAGWQGSDCKQECTKMTYGANCSSACDKRHCYGNDSCDHVTGSCDQGCEAGWEGSDCKQECANTTYGANCSRICAERHCSGDSPCDHVAGSCDQGCQVGWIGSDCKQACDRGHYGPNCTWMCATRQCQGNSTCNHTTGGCDGGCQAGWTGVDCRKCASTTYGANCSSICADRHCSGDSPCDHVTGSCDQGCQAGWIGSDCKQACDRDHYGPNCTVMCANRHCQRNSTCNRTTGECDWGCQAGWTGVDCHTRSTVSGPRDDPRLNQTPVIAGAVVGGVVILVLILILIVLIRKRRVKASKESSCQPVDMNDRKQNDPANVYANIGFDEGKKNTCEPSPVAPAIGGQDGTSEGAARFPDSGSADTLEAEEAEEELEERNTSHQEEGPSVPERNYYNLENLRRGNVIPLSQLEARVRKMEKSSEILAEEFKNLPDGFFHPYDESQKLGNKTKNRFRGYYPYNYNRVVLRNNSDDSRGDYINASYLDGYNQEKQYIAAQGPYKGDVVDDFVRMIWQEECEVVVMVTGLVEGGKMKSLRYWPEEGTSTYGDIIVTMETQTRLADYTITTLTMQGGKESMKRQLLHFNFTSWPDHGVPDTSGLLTFLWRVQKTCGPRKHPVVVHCSAGIGRTGTYIAVESLVSQATAEGTVDVVSFVSNMRSQRKNMIQTKEQYLFIYQAVMAAMVEGDTSFDADIIRNGIDLDNLDYVTMGNKNVRQHLETLEARGEGTASSDSITRVSSYQTKSGFFVMTSHLDKEGIWNHVYNSDSRTLITWADDEEHESYLPSADRSVATSRLTVTLTRSSVLSECVTHNKIGIKGKNDKESIIIQHYHVTGSIRDPGISVLIDSLLQWKGQPESDSTTIVPHSVSEPRLLILLVNITSRLQDDGKVDVISNMRRLQSLLGGPRFTVDDVRVCLKFVQRQFESRGVYANV